MAGHGIPASQPLTAQQILAQILTVDGSGSGLDADTVDGIEAAAFELVANKGVANGYASLDANGQVPIGQIPPTAMERIVTVADQTARYALTTATVQNGDHVKQNDTGIMYVVVDDSNLANATGYIEYHSGTAAAVAWSGITGMPAAIDAIDGLTPAANKLAYYTGASSAALADLSAFGLTLIDDADAPTARGTLDAVGGRGSGTQNTLLKFDANGDATDSAITDDGTSANSSIPFIVGGSNVAAAAWGDHLAVGTDSDSKVLIGYLASTTLEPTVGGHNNILTGWAPINISGTNVRLRYQETVIADVDNTGLEVQASKVLKTDEIDSTSALGITISDELDTGRIALTGAASSSSPLLSVILNSGASDQYGFLISGDSPEGTSRRFSVTRGGEAYIDGDLIFGNTDTAITKSTSDGSDTGSIGICGGGGLGNLRGATVYLYGNEYASSGLEGRLHFIAGSDPAGGDIVFTTNGNNRMIINHTGNFVMGEGTNFNTGATTGSKFGINTFDKIGFWNATPIVQPASANQAALTNSTGGTADGTISAVSSTGDDSTINNNFTELHTLLNEIRTALVNTGLIKGAA